MKSSVLVVTGKVSTLPNPGREYKRILTEDATQSSFVLSLSLFALLSCVCHHLELFFFTLLHLEDEKI